MPTLSTGKCFTGRCERRILPIIPVTMLRGNEGKEGMQSDGKSKGLSLKGECKVRGK